MNKHKLIREYQEEKIEDRQKKHVVYSNSLLSKENLYLLYKTKKLIGSHSIEERKEKEIQSEIAN